MTFGDKLARLRRENNMTQEQLAAAIGVSRQAVSKWESGYAYPETDKMLRMCDLFGCTLDYLIRDGRFEAQPAAVRPVSPFGIVEGTSARMIFGMPLWQTGKHARGFFALGYDARGVIAVGLYAQGVISVGLLSLGVFSLGLLSIALCSFGVLSIGLAAFGAFAAGIIAAGAVCLGVFSMGAVSVGEFAVGALSIGRYAALGDEAHARIAIATSDAFGSVFSHAGEGLTAADRAHVELLIRDVPRHLRWAAALFMRFI